MEEKTKLTIKILEKIHTKSHMLNMEAVTEIEDSLFICQYETVEL